MRVRTTCRSMLPCLQGFWTPQYYSAELSGLLNKCTGRMLSFCGALRHIWFSSVMGRVSCRNHPIARKVYLTKTEKARFVLPLPLPRNHSYSIHVVILRSSGCNLARPPRVLTTMRSCNITLNGNLIEKDERLESRIW